MFVLMDWLSRHSCRECGSFRSDHSLPSAASALSVDSPLRTRIQRSIPSRYYPSIARFIAVARRLLGLNKEYNRSFGGGGRGGTFCPAFRAGSLSGSSSKLLFVIAILLLCSCTIMSQSPYLAEKTRVPVLVEGCGLADIRARSYSLSKMADSPLGH